MVAHLLALRFLVLKNSLARSVWQLVGFVIGALYGLGVVALIVVGLIALSGAPAEISRTVVILAGSALILGWVIIPLLTTGIDQTLDPSRLVTFPIPLNRLVVGLAVAGMLGIPGILSLIASIATAGTWWQQPLIAIVAALCGIVGVVIAVVASRMINALSAGLTSNRRFREASGLLIFIPLILLGPIILFVTSGLRDAAGALPSFAEGLSWSPLGAIWAVPSAVAEGSVGGALARLAIALATIVVLWVIWRWALGQALISPARDSSKTRARGKLGFFNLFPGTPTGAVAARSLTYWLRDPRHSRQLIIVPLLPVLLGFYTVNTGNAGLLNASGPLVAFFLAFSIYSDISYDGTAFSTHLSAGLRGAADRTGRVLALAVFAVPLTLIVVIVSLAITDSWTFLPAILGISIGVLLSGFGLSSVTSARITVPVPEPGDNPFKSPPGSGFGTALATFATWGIMILLVLPELVIGIVAFATGDLLWGWATLLVGIVLGALFLVLGIRIGGRDLDARGPDLLSQLKKAR
ncbi:transporter [Compostimonas suwonensis]|uniref:ABC-2 type transport system permease protein n=1 Tax=Compostimonas suwonensis TaxID=1048394 RepID=A0A2M9BVX9_9MICO|nr:transporter [Compostimonas suwonensis]PJJ62108.1 ABC-2 type transport system permease protein [Compostimonas suwonensis]